MLSRDTVQLLDFVKRAFNAHEISRLYNEDSSVGHAEVRIGDSIVMMFDAIEARPETPGFFRLYVKDGDAVYEQALSEGTLL
ncbi:hypothetical protein GC102_32030 [Paenibacillus sp. LMG 31460]|uniref:Uncharacterized protein n=1 Tax=Paenibacillus germinis TaxID=2654979 RepID=A0ABX1ZAK0_9BACL|nr:hypothetical protein [Paenibacillus germinis]NOU90333.1 hypothetical protein [Paenibacillus germinis]